MTVDEAITFLKGELDDIVKMLELMTGSIGRALGAYRALQDELERIDQHPTGPRVPTGPVVERPSFAVDEDLRLQVLTFGSD